MILNASLCTLLNISSVKQLYPILINMFLTFWYAYKNVELKFDVVKTF